MIEFMEMAADTGVDATQIYSLDQGHGHRPNRDEIYRYFDDVLRASTFPAVLSTHQSVGYQVPVAMLVEFADRFDHLIGINSSHQDLGYLAAIIDALGDRLEIHVGGPQWALTALALGATGYLSSEGNLAPHLCVGVIDAYTRERRHADGATVRRAAPAFGHLLRRGRDPCHQNHPQQTRPPGGFRGPRRCLFPSRPFLHFSTRSSDWAFRLSRAGRRRRPSRVAAIGERQ